MSSLDYFMLVMRYMHILGAITLMGGTIFARFAVLPSLSKLPEAERDAVHTEIRAGWSKFVMIASAFLLISGLVNLGLYGALYKFPTFPYNPVAGVKFLLALPIFFIAALLTGRSGLAKRVQANAKMWLSVNLVLALIMVLIGGGLKFVDRVRKEPKTNTTQSVVFSAKQS